MYFFEIEFPPYIFCMSPCMNSQMILLVTPLSLNDFVGIGAI